MSRIPTFPDCFDEVKQVTITGLKRLGYLQPNQKVNGSIHWTRGDKPSGSIGLTVNLPERYIDFDYEYGETPIHYRVRLESIPKHFGGCEWYFICPETNRRCRKLYGIGERFLSRFAFPSARYSIQTYSKKVSGMSRVLRLSEFMVKPYAKRMYKGKLTKRYARLIGLYE